mmetsp:Transcript_4286/g.6152  ORF Transcript_4286/g.6152 Transcript_4286/m.6152 type:complete len:85 (-) Transcript_4286:113-367(-)
MIRRKEMILHLRCQDTTVTVKTPSLFLEVTALSLFPVPFMMMSQFLLQDFCNRLGNWRPNRTEEQLRRFRQSCKISPMYDILIL